MLKSLKLSFRNLDITWLSHGLQSNRSITWFRLRNESRQAELPGIQFVSCLTSFWRNNPSMKRLILDRCFIGSEGLDILTNALRSRHYAGTLRYLDLSNNFLFFDVDTIDFSGLVGALAKYKRLRRLLLSHNAIGNKGCTSLVELLDNKNCILKELHLDKNWMGLDYLAVLAEPLAKNNTLEYLNLNDNRLDYYNKSNEACWKGWRPMLKLVCNRSSIENIKESNHILCNLGMSSPYHILNAVIKLNANPNKDLVIRQKLIWAHADSRLNIGESSIPTGALPEVIAWFVDDDPNRENGHIIHIMIHLSPTKQSASLDLILYTELHDVGLIYSLTEQHISALIVDDMRVMSRIFRRRSMSFITRTKDYLKKLIVSVQLERLKIVQDSLICVC